MHLLKLCFYSAHMPPSGNTTALHCSAVLLKWTKSCTPDPGFDDVQTCIHSTRGIFCLFIARFMPEMQVGWLEPWHGAHYFRFTWPKRFPGIPRNGGSLDVLLPPLDSRGFRVNYYCKPPPASTHTMFDNGEWPEPTFDEHRENIHARELGDLNEGGEMLC